MSTTINDQTRADRGRYIRTGLLDALLSAWDGWRARLRKACGCFASVLALLAITACDGATDFGPSPCPGSVSLTWFITNASGQFASCAEVGANSVALRLQSRTGGTPVFTAFPCASSPGTANVAPGLYDVAIELRDANGTRLATVPQQTSIAVATGRTRVLAPVGFTVGAGGGNPPGNIRLTLRAEGVAFNCRPSPGGAAITGTIITVERVSGGCAAVTFLRNVGNAQVGTYQVNCSSPEVASCIETDEVLTSPDLVPGSYVIRVRGKIGPVDCWTAERQIDVPQAGQLQAQVVLKRQNGPGC